MLRIDFFGNPEPLPEVFDGCPSTASNQPFWPVMTLALTTGFGSLAEAIRKQAEERAQSLRVDG